MACAVFGLAAGALPASAGSAIPRGCTSAVNASANLRTCLEHAVLASRSEAIACAEDTCAARTDEPNPGEIPALPVLIDDDLEGDDLDASLRSAPDDLVCAGVQLPRASLHGSQPIRREDARNPRPPNV